jgi:hypothetical protein
MVLKLLPIPLKRKENSNQEYLSLAEIIPVEVNVIEFKLIASADIE